MGVESDRLVFDYLSRVGDLAQTALPASERMQLVAQLRKDIDRERGGADSPAAVQRILGRIGSPDAVVEAAAGSGGAGRPAPAAPEPPYAEPPPGAYGPYAKQRRPSRAEGAGQAERGEPREGVPGPRKDAGEPDWWRADPGGLGRMRGGEEVAGLTGMTGEIFIPFDDEDLLERDLPAPDRGGAEPAGSDGAAADGGAPAAEAAAPARKPLWRLLPGLGGGRAAGGGGSGGGGGGGRRWGSPMLLIAAALLVAGAVAGSWVPLLLGWGAGYVSRQLTRTQAKFAVLGIPGAAAFGMLVWIWGRDAGKWSTPIAQGQMGHVMQDALPLTVRLAATGSALYFLWRARSRPA